MVTRRADVSAVGRRRPGEGGHDGAHQEGLPSRHRRGIGNASTTAVARPVVTIVGTSPKTLRQDHEPFRVAACGAG
jgi:hypothetical protein